MMRSSALGLLLLSSTAALAQTPLASGPSVDWFPAWSPDGGRVAFSRRTAEGESDLRVLVLRPPEPPVPLWAHVAVGLVLLAAGGLAGRQSPP